MPSSPAPRPRREPRRPQPPPIPAPSALSAPPATNRLPTPQARGPPQQTPTGSAPPGCPEQSSAHRWVPVPCRWTDPGPRGSPPHQRSRRPRRRDGPREPSPRNYHRSSPPNWCPGGPGIRRSRCPPRARRRRTRRADRCGSSPGSQAATTPNHSPPKSPIRSTRPTPSCRRTPPAPRRSPNRHPTPQPTRPRGPRTGRSRDPPTRLATGGRAGSPELASPRCSDSCPLRGKASCSTYVLLKSCLEKPEFTQLIKIILDPQMLTMRKRSVWPTHLLTGSAPAHTDARKGRPVIESMLHSKTVSDRQGDHRRNGLIRPHCGRFGMFDGRSVPDTHRDGGAAVMVAGLSPTAPG